MTQALRDAAASFSSLRAGLGVRIGVSLFAASLFLLAVWGWLSGISLQLQGVVPEQFPRLELLQITIWTAICGLGVVASATNRQYRGILLALWLCVISMLAVFRELDLQTLLNPQNIHLIGLDAEQGVRYRLDWWTSAQTSAVLRASWAGLFILVMALVVLPFALARYPWFSQAFRLAPFALLFGLGVASLGAGYVIDDFLGRPMMQRGVDVSIYEEIAELVGPILILAAASLLALRCVRLFPQTVDE